MIPRPAAPWPERRNRPLRRSARPTVCHSAPLRRRALRVRAGVKASGISGSRMAFDFLLEALPRLLELGFFDFVWADDLPVVCVVEDLAVVCVVDLRLFDDFPGSGGGWVVVDDGGCVVFVEDDDVYLSVTSMLRCPSLDSVLPSLTTNVKSSVSTPVGAW